MNGVNGADHDADMANGEEGAGQANGGGAVGLQGERQPNKDRVTTPYLTKYERARILGTRALQIRCVFMQPYRNVKMFMSIVGQYERTRASTFGW